MPKKGGSLTFPKDPLAAMQELSELDAPHLEEHDEAVNTYSNPEANTQVSNEISKATSKQPGDDGIHSPSVPSEVPPIAPVRRSRMPTSSPPAKPASTPRSVATPAVAAAERASPETVPQTARRRLLAQAEKEATTRLSIDVPLPMYNRIKQYIAVNNVESIRALTLALYEDFLTEEQF